jgi:hypothetical protein
MSIEEYIELIETKKDFTMFLRLLAEDFKNNKDEWESWTLEGYLEAVEALCHTSKDIDEKPSWKNFAIILWSATVYE